MMDGLRAGLGARLVRLALALAGALLVAPAADALEPPALTARVNDLADLLPEAPEREPHDQGS